ncbi:hypothetical protein ACFE04_013799 [Oxalis oulophora]
MSVRRRLDKVCSFGLFSRCFSATSDEQSFAVSYLIEKCGLSQKSALAAAKYVHFESSEKPDAVLGFFGDVGFTKSQLSRLFTAAPRLVLCRDAQKIYMPKIEFLKSKGFTGTDLVRTLCVSPTILSRSLEGYIIPHFKYLKGLFGSDDKVIFALKRYPQLFIKSTSLLESNIAILQQHGVPQSKILYLLKEQPQFLFATPDLFKDVVEEITKMGVDHLKLNFVIAVYAKLSMSKSTWEKKLDAYKKWGLSEEEISQAFAKYPWCMTISEKKLSAVMGTFINKLGLDSSAIRKCPCMIGFSLKKRITPRASVIQVLLSKGLIDKFAVTGTAFVCSEESFLNKFVVKYEDKVPNLSMIYKEQLSLGCS